MLLNRKLKIILIALFIITILKIIFHLNDNNNNKNVKSKESNNRKKLTSDCEQEWVMLKKDKCYFRKNVAFYFIDSKKIRLGFLNDNKYKYSFKLKIQVIINGNHVNTYILHRYKTSLDGYLKLFRYL